MACRDALRPCLPAAGPPEERPPRGLGGERAVLRDRVAGGDRGDRAVHPGTPAPCVGNFVTLALVRYVRRYDRQSPNTKTPLMRPVTMRMIPHAAEMARASFNDR